MHEHRAGEGSGEWQQLQMQLEGEQTTSQCCRVQALLFLWPIPMLVACARQGEEPWAESTG